MVIDYAISNCSLSQHLSCHQSFSFHLVSMANTFSLQKAKHTNYGYEYTHQVQWNLRIMHILNAYWMIEESEHSQSNYYRSGFHWNQSKHLRHSVQNSHTLKDNDSHVVEIVPVPFELSQWRKICKSPTPSGFTSHRQLVDLIIKMPVTIESTVIKSDGTETG